MSTDERPEPDTKDWTVVVDAGCRECGFDPEGVAVTDVPGRLLATVPGWQAALVRPDAAERRDRGIWSVVEYACHVRDVCSLFRRRLELMLAEEAPVLPDWDGEAAAVDGGYATQDPAAVGQQLAGELQACARAWDGIPAGAEQRRAVRSDGREFTVRTLSLYFLHEVEHHLADVG